jgi:hypothetical protein
MTFTLPDALARQVPSAYPHQKRSRVVAGLLAKKLREEGSELAKACRDANGLVQVEKEMEAWEGPNLPR